MLKLWFCSFNYKLPRNNNNNNNNNNNTELQKLDRKTRKLLTIQGQHHPKAYVDRLHVPGKKGGRGLMQLEAAHAVEITKLVEYVDWKKTH